VEGAAAGAVDEVWVCSTLDAERLAATVSARPPIRVVPNIVPGGMPDLPSVRRRSDREGPLLLFQGHLSYRPNVMAARFLAERIVPAVRAMLPEARLVLAGRRPHRHVDALRGDRIEIIADPPDLAPILERADLAILPLRIGSGTRIKALEALAWGLPVVATARAVEGLDMVEDVHFSRAESASQFAAAIVTLWRDADLYQRRVDAGRDLVLRQYTQASLVAAMAPTFTWRADRAVPDSAALPPRAAMT
jgi:glycosyltransferase involved in cell wall biosynthesis